MIRVPGVQKTTPNMVSLQAPQVQQFEQTEGIQMLGQAASTAARAGSKLVEIGNRGMRNARVSKAKEGQVRAAQEISRLLQDRDSGYLTKQGGAARDGISDFERELAEVNKKLRASFDDDETREMFEQATAVDFTRAQTAAGLHWAKQSQVANAAQSKVRYGQLADDVAAGDWGARVDLRDEVNEYGRVVGLSEEQRQELYKDTLSNSAATFVGTLLAEGDLDGAELFLSMHGDHIDRAKEAALGNQHRKLAKSEAAIGKLEQRNAKAQSAVIALLDKHSGTGRLMPGAEPVPGSDASAPPPTPSERQAAVLDDLMQQRRDNMEDPTKGLSPEEYNTARQFLSGQINDAIAEDSAALDADLAALDTIVTADPTQTVGDLSSGEHRNLMRRLGASTGGREIIRKLTTVQGKAEARKFYLQINTASRTGDTETIRNYFPLGEDGVPGNMHYLAGLTQEQYGKTIDLILRAHGREPNDKGRLRGSDLVHARIKGRAWAHIGGDPDEGVNTLIVDDMVREMNRDLTEQKLGHPPTADDERNWLESQMREGTYRYLDDSVVPRAALRSLDKTVMGGVTGMTVAGSLKPSDISMSVRQLAYKTAFTALRKSNNDQPPTERQAAQRAEALWLQLGSPSTVEAFEAANKAFKEGKLELLGSNMRKSQVGKMLSDTGDAEAIGIAKLTTPALREAQARKIAELRLESDLGDIPLERREASIQVVMRRLLRGAEAYNNAKANFPAGIGSAWPSYIKH